MIGAPLVAATFDLCAMYDTNSTLNGLIGAPLVAATSLHGITRDANSALEGSIRAPFVAAMHPRVSFSAKICVRSK